MTETEEVVNEEAPTFEPSEEIERVPEPDIKNEVKEETNEVKVETTEVKEDSNKPEITNKTERLSKKTITCPKCDKSMLLRSYRYKHEKSCQGHLENRKIKTQAKPKPKPKVVTIQPTPLQPKAIESTNEPTYLLEAKQKSIIQEQPIKSPHEIIFDSYKLIHQEYINKRKEKYNNLCANMFSGNLRSKRK